MVDSINGYIKILFNENRWKEICNLYSADYISSNLSFSQAIQTAYELLYNDGWDEDMQVFAWKLLQSIQRRHPEEWQTDWRYDVLMAEACDVTLKYDERYVAIKKACEKAGSPPPELMIELARCCYSPGDPPIGYNEAIEILKKSIEYHPYKEAVELLKAIYGSKKDARQEAYWAKMLENTHETAPIITSQFRSKI